MPKNATRRTFPAPAAVALVILAVSSGALAGVVGSPHDFSKSSAISKYRTTPIPPSATVGSGGVCSVCHIPHNAQYGVLWPRNLATYDNALLMDGDGGSSTGLPNYRREQTLQCYDCHDWHRPPGNSGTFTPIDASPSYSDFETNHKPQNIAFGYSTTATPKDSGSTMKEDPPSGSESGFYENSPPFAQFPTSYYGADARSNSELKRPITDNQFLAKTGGHYFKSLDPTSGSVYKGDKLPCSDCHDPHAWDGIDRDWQAFFRPKKLYGYPNRTSRWGSVFASSNPRASTYMANDITELDNVTVGRSDSESRRMCILCHSTSDAASSRVTFNDINSAYTSTQQIIALPTTIGEHGSTSNVACVSCHAHNNIGASCTQCHGFPPSDTANPRYPDTPTSRFVPVPDPLANDSHPRHYGAKSGQGANSFSVYSFDCGTCHYGSALGRDSTLGDHQNSKVSVVIEGLYTSTGISFDNANYYNRDATLPPSFTGQLDNTNNLAAGGWGNGARYGGNRCRNVYCHSVGRDPSYMAANNDNDYRRPDWNGGRLGCNGCHGDPAIADNTNLRYGMPNYVSGGGGTGTANSHGIHVVNNRYECSVCHAGTATGAAAAGNRAIPGTTPTLHVNRVRNVQFDGTTAIGSYDNATGVKRCDVSCHGQGKPIGLQPQWGGVLANGCFDCHTGTEASNKPQDNTSIPNPVDNNEYLHSGHGRSGSNYPGSNNAPAGFSNYATAPVACYVCHSQAASHTTKSGNDPFRLGHALDNTLGGFGGSGGFTGAWADNTDALCLGCHGTAAQRSGHDNAATDNTTAVDASTHARGITGVKYNWPISPWKCVDCHDPHGDGRSTAQRYYMVRSAVNAPDDITDTAAGSDPKSRPKRTAGLRAVTFNSLAGYATGSYTQPGNGAGGVWGPCEVCHTQTNAYSRTLDNAASHASRTNRCTTCHPHNAGFAPTACKGCHGPDGVAPTAPDISAYWSTSGHGKFNIECEDCHDTSYLTSSAHKTDGSVPGSPPNNINTQTWPGKGALTADTTPNLNTPHLKPGYINASPGARADIARTFDNFCATAAGCHDTDYHRHQMANGPPPQDVMRFGDHNTVANPKAYNWYSLVNYPVDFYRSRSPWADNDIRLQTGLSDPATSYGLCVSCHDPHGTNTTDTSFYPVLGTSNHMVRGNWRTDSVGFCNTACHTSRTPP